MSSTPVLLLAWRRPDLTERALAAIATHRPERLFLACDGWDEDSPPEVIEAIRATRAVLDRVPDWPCVVERRYADRNLGSRFAVSGALDWFFAHCPEGIVLEDDCLPHPEFFAYCSELLERYRDDTRIMCISGDNSSGTSIADGSSYGFVRWPLIWGWATWRRAWNRFDHDLGRVAIIPSERWHDVLPDPEERRVWAERMSAMLRSGRTDIWDFVWSLSVIADGGLCVLPASNLVTNIGVGPGATHTETGSASTGAPTAPILPLRHPAAVRLDEAASRRVFDVALDGAGERRRFAWERTLRGRLRLAAHRVLVPILPRSFVTRVRGRGNVPPWLR